MTTPNHTKTFLGDKNRWRAARIELDDAQPLSGGHRVSVTGAGFVTLEMVAPTGESARRAFVLLPEETRRLFALCIQHDILVPRPGGRPGLPDEARPAITLVNAAGQRRTVAAWLGEMDAAFSEVYAALRALAEPAPAELAGRRHLAGLAAQLEEKERALDRFGHQPHIVAVIEKEIASLEAQIAAQQLALSQTKTP